MPQLPTGTVTFMFTDIEASTRLLHSVGERYADVLEEHHRLVRDVVARGGGLEFGTEGDAFFLAFTSAPAAVAAAADLQRAFARSSAGEPGVVSVRVRIGLHTGEGVVRGDDYVGLDLHRVARITAAGHGGQILVSEATRGLVRDDLPAGTSLRDLGEHRLKDLERPERLYQLDVDGLPGTFPSLRGVETPGGNLPQQLTSFVGRKHEMEKIHRLLAETRLLCMTGPGGTGKTRLALRLADSLRSDFADGVWFVALASITDATLVPATIAEVLSLPEPKGDSRGWLERLAEHLRDRDLLLVLDNFEQVLPAASVVSELLRSTRRLKIVITSRAVLRLHGEREFPVPPLGLPDPRALPDLAALSQYEAVALFVDRAMAVRPDFAVTNENAPAVAEICARLDGLPLAIELAAARIRLLSPQAMLARLGDRLALLSGGARDLPARQQTLRQAIAWSHDLLSPAERRLFARIAVFTGGCALDEAEAVCGPREELGMEVLDGLGSLAEKSLVGVGEDEQGDPRFTMLETIREFALEKLSEAGEEDEIRRRHASAYLRLAEFAEPKLTGRERRPWLARLDQEHDNLRAALERAVERGEVRLALRLSGALWRFWQMRGHLQEVRPRVEQVLAMPGAADHPRERAKALEAAGGIAYWQFDLDAQLSYYEQSLAVAEELQDDALVANGLYNVSFALMQEKTQEAFELLERSLALYERLGDRSGVTKARWGMGNASYTAGDHQAARGSFLESLRIAREIDDDFHIGWSLFMLGAAEKHLGLLDSAGERWRASLRLFADARDLTGILFNIEGLGDLAMLGGRSARGVRLIAAASRLRSSTGAELTEWERQNVDEPSGEDEELVRSRAEGEAMTLDEAIAYALEE